MPRHERPKLYTKSGHILFDLAWIAGVDYHDSDDYSDENDREKVVYDYEEVNYKSNNEEGKWDAKDNNQVIETDKIDPNDIEVDHLSNGQDLQENYPIQDQSVSENSNDHDNNSEEEQPQPMDNFQRLTRSTQPPSQYIPSFKGKSYKNQADIQQGMLFSQ